MARKFRAIQSTKTKKPKNLNINHLSLFVLLYVKVSYLLNNLSNLKTKPIKSYIYIFPKFPIPRMPATPPLSCKHKRPCGQQIHVLPLAKPLSIVR